MKTVQIQTPLNNKIERTGQLLQQIKENGKIEYKGDFEDDLGKTIKSALNAKLIKKKNSYNYRLAYNGKLILRYGGMRNFYIHFKRKEREDDGWEEFVFLVETIGRILNNSWFKSIATGVIGGVLVGLILYYLFGVM